MFDAMEVDYKPAHWESACRQILLDGLSSGDLVAAVAESDDGRVVASGIGAIRRWLPSPRNPSGLRGYIGSVATDTDWRRQGVGRQVIESLIEMRQRFLCQLSFGQQIVIESDGFAQHNCLR